MKTRRMVTVVTTAAILLTTYGTAQARPSTEPALPVASVQETAPNNAMGDVTANGIYLKTGAAIRDAWGNTFARAQDVSTPKQFHRMERIGPMNIEGSNTYLYWMRGAGSGEPSGFVSRGHIVNPGDIDGQLDMRWAAGNGAPRTTTSTIGYFRLHPISDDMGYAGPSDGVCRQYKWYGVKGTFPDGKNYAYLSWSLPNVRVGGMVRTSFRDGEAFRHTDTQTLRLKAYRYSYPTCDEEVGWVDYKYVRIYQNGHLFFGWAVSASYFKDEGVVKDHMD
ncbi:MAG: hypothetical protein M3548_09940 [Actinomycetota bacterium]|nr:hypothetical protein [Actinomycetota bacterium]